MKIDFFAVDASCTHSSIQETAGGSDGTTQLQPTWGSAWRWAGSTPFWTGRQFGGIKISLNVVFRHNLRILEHTVTSLVVRIGAPGATPIGSIYWTNQAEFSSTPHSRCGPVLLKSPANGSKTCLQPGPPSSAILIFTFCSELAA